MKEKTLYCSTLLFVLIKNVDEIRYKSNDNNMIKITRTEINDLYEFDVSVLGTRRDDFLIDIPSLIESKKGYL